MAQHGHNAAINAAIRATVKDMRQSLDGSWMALVPKDAPMSMPDDQEWLDFLGRTMALVNASIAPCTAPDPASLRPFKSKQLIALRDHISGKIACR